MWSGAGVGLGGERWGGDDGGAAGYGAGGDDGVRGGGAGVSGAEVD